MSVFADDKVINPDHYKSILVIPADRLKDYLDPEGNVRLEYIDIMEFTMTPEEFKGHLKGQAFKYMFRLGKKDSPPQEVEKSRWYLGRMVKFLMRK